MPTCPNCGELLMTGDPYCTHCGATIRWYDEEEDDGGSSEIDVSELLGNEILVDLYNQGFFLPEVLNMKKEINQFMDEFSCELISAEPYNDIVLFNFLKEENYWSTTLRVTYDSHAPVWFLTFHEDLIVGNFEKLYADEKFRELIRKEEKERNIKAKRCKLSFFSPNIFVVLVIFDKCEGELDCDTMSFISWADYTII